jgi:hypothetical protein
MYANWVDNESLVDEPVRTYGGRVSNEVIPENWDDDPQPRSPVSTSRRSMSPISTSRRSMSPISTSRRSMSPVSTSRRSMSPVSTSRRSMSPTRPLDSRFAKLTEELYTDILTFRLLIDEAINKGVLTGTFYDGKYVGSYRTIFVDTLVSLEDISGTVGVIGVSPTTTGTRVGMIGTLSRDELIDSLRETGSVLSFRLQQFEDEIKREVYAGKLPGSILWKLDEFPGKLDMIISDALFL